jgi:hypothetical protein
LAVLFLQVKKNGVLYILILNQIKVENMYFTGFADEASKNIEGADQCHIGAWLENIEARNIGGINIRDLKDEKFA